MIELALYAVLAVFTVLALRLLRGVGPVAHWVLGWAAGGLAAFLPYVGDAWPRLELVAHPLGTLFSVLLLSGALLLADRRVPAWLVPGALAFGLVRATLASRFGDPVGYALALACEPIAVAVAARVAWRPDPRGDASPSERLLGPALALLAATGVVHLVWLVRGWSPTSLLPLWVLVAPFVLGVQVQAAANRLRRRIRDELGARVAERTAALAASEERYRAVSDLTTDFAFKIHIDPALRLSREWVSGAFAKTLGMEPAELDGHGWIALIEPAERERALSDLERGDGRRTTDLVVPLRRRDGSACAVALRLGAFERDPDGTVHILGSGRDVTELRDAERERERLARHVEQVERLESLGILAGGIAHDFNNLLTVIRGSAKLALAELAPEAPARTRVERIATAAEHAAALTEEMLAYAGRSATTLEPLDLAALVRDMGELLRASVPSTCALELAIDAASPAVLGDANGLRRVLLNLVLNAAEALGEKPGHVAVRVAPCTAAQTELDDCFGTPGLAPGAYVALEVADDGSGMDEETQRRLFEPFFSTKFSGRGLGMAAVLGIVQAHRGAIGVASAMGQGSRVRVLLPPSPQAVAAVAPEPRDAAPPARAARVLVVDDDEGVLELAREVLVAAGHRVETASGGRAALDLLRADPARCDVVVLDLTMPDVGGEVVFRDVRALRADLPVVLATGYDAAHAAERFADLDGFLRKPWEPEALVAAVEQARRRADAGH